ncbi:MAG: hypothetical protein K0Q91_844 [Fibrobacteria bacterium]|jgi:hypothetical protein|nr:hypothetical protein [Fibrobacteria bacterium]
MNRFSTQNILSLTVLSLGLVLTGCLTDDDGDGDGVTVADSLSVRLVTVGAQDNADYGSALDIDNMVAYKIAEAKTRTGDIDLIYAVSTSGIGGTPTPAIYSPDSAKGGINGSAGFTFLSDFNNPNHTVIKSSGLTTQAAFDAINTKEKLDSLWTTAAVDADGKINLVVDGSFMAMSNTGRKVLIRVINFAGTGTGNSANFKAQAKF